MIKPPRLTRTAHQKQVMNQLRAFWHSDAGDPVRPPVSNLIKGVVWVVWYCYNPDSRTRHVGVGAMLDWVQEHGLVFDFVRPITLPWWRHMRKYFFNPWGKVLVVQIPPNPV